VIWITLNARSRSTLGSTGVGKPLIMNSEGLVGRNALFFCEGHRLILLVKGNN
jgi:hypothetical protein